MPLAFAFLATLGRLGLVTVLLRNCSASIIYARGFNLLSFWGLTLTYLYFQIPLMVLIVDAGARRAEARMARGGARCSARARWQYWRYVALPDPLAERCSARTLLLFANAFGAIATAYALTGSLAQHRADPALRADPRRRAARPESRLRAGARHDRHHRRLQRRLYLAARAAASGGCR